MRRLVFSLVLLLATVSAATGVRASTECEQWLRDYKDSLAHSPLAHHIHNAHNWAHKKLLVLRRPQPLQAKVLPARFARPKMTREEMLKKFELACGDLPVDGVPLGNLKADGAPGFAPAIPADEPPVELASAPAGGILPMTAVPPYGSPGGGYPGFPGYPNPGSPGSPVSPPSSPGCTVTSGSDKSLGTCGTEPPPPPPVVTPEPGTSVLLLTGLSGMVELLRRRRRSS